VVGELDASVKGLTILAAGGKYGRQVNVGDFVRQAQDTAGFWTSVYELNASHPYLPKRIAALLNHRTPDTVPAVKRNPWAYPLAPMFSFGAGAGPGALVMVAIIAILAAIAIPQFSAFKAKAEKSAMHATLREIHAAAKKYHDNKGRWPCSTGDLKLQKTLTLARANKWQMEVNCEQNLAGIIYRGKDGKRYYEAIYFETAELESGSLKD
jgi:competence protein ComGC